MVAHLPACNRCQATIRWVRMRSGRPMPVNPVALSAPETGRHGLVTNPAARTTVGNVACTVIGNNATDGHVISKTETAAACEHVYRPHWADCPKGKTKPRTQTTEQPALFG